MSSRSRIAGWLMLTLGVTACASVIGIGDPALDTGEGTTLPVVEASTTADTSTAAMDATTVEETGTAADSATPPPPPQGTTMPCTSANCALATNTCCAFYQKDMSLRFECAVTCPQPTGDTVRTIPLKCTQPSDCPGKKCCAALYSTSSGASCKTDCAPYEAVLCTPGMNAPCNGKLCQKFSGYGICDK